MAAVVKPRLEELPEEMVSNIAIKLDSDSSFAFRLVCRSLEERSLHEWATEYFGGRAIVPTSGSLRILASIAESEKLRSFVHQLYIVPALFSQRNVACCHGKTCKLKHTIRQEEAMHGYVEDQKALMDEMLTARLTHIFQQLPKLQGIMFTDAFTNIPAEVGIYGHASYTRRTNNTLSTKPKSPGDKEFYEWKGYVWKALMKAIAISGIDTLDTFYCSLDNVRNPLTLNDVNFDRKTLQQLGKVLGKIENLRLQITSSSKAIVKDHHTFDRVKAIKVNKNIAQLMSSLTYLDLTYIYDPTSSIMCRTFIDKVDVSKLNRLRLNEVYLDSKFLGTLICKLVNVETIFLEYIYLTKGTWPTILEAMQKLKKLQHLHLTHVAVPSGGACFVKALEQSDAARENGTNGFGGILGGAAGAGAANHAGALPGFDDGFSDEYDSEFEDESMPDLEPQTVNTSNTAQSQPVAPTTAATAVQPPPPAQVGPEALAQALYSLYSSSSGETDDEMPDLAPNGTHTVTQPPAPQASASTNGNIPAHSRFGDISQNQEDADSSGPNLGQGIEHGRVICLNSAKEVKEYLPQFIKDYRVMDEDAEDDLFAGGGIIPIPGGVMGVGGVAGAGAGPIPPLAGGQAQGQGAAGGIVGHGPPPSQVANMLNALFGPVPQGHVGGHGGNNAHGHGTNFTFQGPFFGPPPPPNANANAQNGGGATAPANPLAPTVESEDEWTEDDMD